MSFIMCDKCKKAGIARVDSAPIVACCPSCGALLHASAADIALQRELRAVAVSDLITEVNKKGQPK